MPGKQTRYRRFPQSWKQTSRRPSNPPRWTLPFSPLGLTGETRPCPRFGETIMIEGSLCPFCIVRIDDSQPSSSKEPDMNPPTPHTCPQCSQPILLGAQFCSFCRARVGAQAVPPAPPARSAMATQPGLPAQPQYASQQNGDLYRRRRNHWPMIILVGGVLVLLYCLVAVAIGRWQGERIPRLPGLFGQPSNTATPQATSIPTPTQIPTSTPKPSITTTPLPQEQEAWEKISCMDVQALQMFVESYPGGTHGNDAQLYLSLFQKIEAIKSGLVEPGFVIPFDQLGARWQGWKERRPDRGAVGIYRNSSSLGIFWAIPGCSTISMDEYGGPITPTGDGSILTIRTSGFKLEYLEGIVMESYGDDVLYFAVIEGKGLVHIHGWGKVTMPDGSEVELK